MIIPNVSYTEVSLTPVKQATSKGVVVTMVKTPATASAPINSNNAVDHNEIRKLNLSDAIKA